VTDPRDEEFEPSAGARSTLRWAHEMGAETLGEAYDLLDQLEVCAIAQRIRRDGIG